MSLHDFEEQLKAAERRIKNATYSEKDKETLFSYEDQLFTEDLSLSRISKYLGQLNRLRHMMSVDFEDATERDLKNLVGKVQRDEGLAASTKKDYKICIRKFYQWLKPDDYPSLLEWLTIKERIANSKVPEDLLTEDDVLKMVDVSNHVRDKALIATLYDSAARIGEMANLKIKHVHFDELGAQVTLTGKTGMRRIRTIVCVPYLASWLSIHPHRDNPESFVWINVGTRSYGEPMSYAGYNILLKRIAGKAGVKKRIYPHLFRHSRCTILAQNLTEAQLEKYAGWVTGSDMSGVYVHLSGKDLDRAILKLYGLEIDESKPQTAFKRCPRCDTTNETTNKICKKCGFAFNIKDAIEMGEKSEKSTNQLIERMKDNPELKSFLEDLICKAQLREE
ncbi:integrase family protein [Methanolobus psychrophilus R15]|nr:integrase family protein [Methanolobus psychrophilus R15]